MKRLLVLLMLVVAPVAQASSEGGELPAFRADLENTAGLQRGLRTFANYCVSCHSAKFMRYSRLAQDLKLTPEQVTRNLVFNGGDMFQTMTVSMRPRDAVRWFGVAPPDLSVVARARGADWLYGYLTGFYVDPERPFGVNNTVFPNAAMPHVLGQLQGVQELHDGHLKLVRKGQLGAAEYDALVRDLVSFLVYLGEPAKLVRYGLGLKVVLFLAVFAGFAYLLKREYWKHLH